MILVPSDENASELLVDDIRLPAQVDAAAGDCARVLQLNRPRKRNALTTSLLDRLVSEIDRASADRRVRGLVVCGSGGTFCAGGDVTEFDGSAGSRDGVLARSRLLVDVASRLEHSRLPTLAVVTGPAAGGGAVLALACDMAVATPDMRLGFPELRSSVVPSLVIPSALAAFGRRLAFDLLTSGRYLDIHEALERGVIGRVADPGELRETVTDVLSGWAAVDSGAMSETKRLLNEMHAMSPSDAVQAGLDATASLWRPRVI